MLRAATVFTLILCLACVVVPVGLAQSTGTISGFVNDATGAVVVGADVTLINQANTSNVRHSTSNGAGFFSLAGLAPGDYLLEVSSKGFEKYSLAGIHVLPGDSKDIRDIALRVQAAKAEVEVQANSAQVQTVDSGDVSSVLNAKDVRGLPVQGRDITEAIRILPGFVNTAGGLKNQSIDTQVESIGGSTLLLNLTTGLPNFSAAGSGFADLIADGARVTNSQNQATGTQTVNADMTAEVKVSTSAYTAEQARGPVVVQAVGKSGSTSFHGGVYLHARDSVMNSNNAYSKILGVPRDDSRYMYPGGSIGGPVLIPGTSFNKSKKLTFWAGFEVPRQTYPDSTVNGVLLANLPTVSERAGNLSLTAADNLANCSALLANPNTKGLAGLRCLGVKSIVANGVMNSVTNSNISSLIGPAAKAYLGLVPLPNATPTSGSPYNYVQNVLNIENGYIFHTRVDYVFTDNTKLNVSYNRQIDNTQTPIASYFFAFPNQVPNPGQMTNYGTSNTVAGNLVHVFNSQLLNEFSASFTGVDGPGRWGNPAVLQKSNFGAYPNIGMGSSYMPGLSNFSVAFGYPTISSGDDNKPNGSKTFSFGDNLTKVIHNHVLKAGVNYIESRNQSTFGGPSNGSLAYLPQVLLSLLPNFTLGVPDGNLNPLALFLTDSGQGYSAASDLPTNVWNRQLGFFLEDKWNVNQRLTLTLGMRLDHWTPWTPENDVGLATFSAENYQKDIAGSGFNPITNQFATLNAYPGVRTHATDSNIPLAGRSLQSLFFAPRIGVAFDMFGTGDTVLRGGIGKYYALDPPGLPNDAFRTATPATSCSFNSSNVAPGTPTGAATGLYRDLVGNYAASLTAINQGIGIKCSDATHPLPYQSITAIDPKDDQLPSTYTYSVGISQRTSKATVLELTYRGSKSINLQNPWTNINAIPVGTYFNAAAAANPGGLTVDQRTQWIYDNIVNKASTTGNQGYINQYRPFSYYGGVALQQHQAWANYNALQASWRKTTGRLIYTLNYTWSKGLQVTGVNPDMHKSYGPLDSDRSHVFNVSALYDFGRHFKSSHLLSALLDNWTVSNITTLQSGANMQTSGGGALNFGSPTLNFGGTTAYVLDKKGSTDPNAWTYETINTTYFLGTADGTLMPIMTCPSPTATNTNGQYFNPACFTLPDHAANTNQRYWFPYTHGPMYFNSDLTIAKSFTIKDRHRFTFQATATNFLNHPLPGFNLGQTLTTQLGLGQPSSVISNAINYQRGVLQLNTFNPQGATVPYGAPVANSGLRIIQLTLRYDF